MGMQYNGKKVIGKIQINSKPQTQRGELVHPPISLENNSIYRWKTS